MDDNYNQNNNNTDSGDLNRPQITPDHLKEFITYIITNIVTQKDQVDVAVMEDVPESYTVHIKVAAEDKGRVIGKKGNTINALRALVRVYGRILILIQD